MDNKKEYLELPGTQKQNYGIIYKIPMLDSTLHITAKAIYAYICSFGDKDHTAYPSRSLILDELGINKETYYKYLTQLTDRKYLTIQKQRHGQFENNLYIIEDKSIPNPKITGDCLLVTGIAGRGYGMLPQPVMRSKLLSHKAKAMYAYFTAFLGGGTTVWPKAKDTQHYLHLSENTYLKVMRELEANGLVTKTQKREQGRMAGFYYSIRNEISDTPSPDIKKPDMGKSDKKKPPMKKSPMKVPPMANSDTNKTALDSTSSNSTILSTIAGSVFSIDDKETLVSKINAKLGHPSDPRVQHLIQLVAKTCQQKTCRGQKPEQFVPRLLNLTLAQYQEVIRANEGRQGIRNMNGYYIACLMAMETQPAEQPKSKTGLSERDRRNILAMLKEQEAEETIEA